MRGESAEQELRGAMDSAVQLRKARHRAVGTAGVQVVYKGANFSVQKLADPTRILGS